jgi:hypothetical protein
MFEELWASVVAAVQEALAKGILEIVTEYVTKFFLG